METGPGETFSRKNATETSKAISDKLGDVGVCVCKCKYGARN